jgi:nucleotide-binding universal stress UspA family protein
LVAIDEFDHSQPLISYVSALTAGSEHFHVHLFHTGDPLSPDLLESTGAEDPEVEVRVEQNQERAQDRWVAKMRADTERQFAAQISQLSKARIPQQNILTHFVLLNQRDDLLKEIIDTARENNCGTIIVGRESYSWLRELFQPHVGEKLIAEIPDMAVCVVSQ